MVAVGMLLIWGGYAVSLWGWCLVKDYDVSFGKLVSPWHPLTSWPPPAMQDTVIWPGQTPAAASQPSSGGGGAGPPSQGGSNTGNPNAPSKGPAGGQAPVGAK